MLCFLPQAYAQTTIQQLIDGAAPGATITIPEGQYFENIVIDKPLTLTGAVTIHSINHAPAIMIEKTNNVVLDRLTIETEGTAIELQDTQNISLTDLELTGVNIGVKVHNSAHLKVKSVRITGRNVHYSQKGNGFAIYDSSDVTIRDSTINNVQDGIYLEEVSQVMLEENTVERSRYGVHFMYSGQGRVLKNYMTNNVTGFMVMMTKDVQFTDNKLTKQRGLNGYGTVLYDVSQLTLQNNLFSQNRTAISIQDGEQITIQSNDFQMNETAIEAMKSDKTNKVVNNVFTGNILTARSDQNGVYLNSNYYDDYSGIDVDGNGIGDTHYVALSSFGQWMVREPAYQYFVEAPAVTLLATVDQQTNRVAQNLLTDDTPMMTMSRRDTQPDKHVVIWQVMFGFFIVILSSYWWKKGLVK